MDDSFPTPSTVLAGYAQSFVEGRRVVVFGDCTSGLAEALMERGARLVHVYDADLARVTEATARGSSPNIAYAPLGQSGVIVRDGTFDVAIIENLAASDDAAGLIRRARRAIAARGITFVATPNLELTPKLLADPEQTKAGPSYYELYELVSAEFSEVRMVGQTPFVGYALAEFGTDARDLFSIDTGFVEGGAEEPEWYLAVASHFALTLDPFSVIQLPAEEVLQALPVGSSALAPDAVEQAAHASANKASAELEQAQELQRLRLELEKRDAWAGELEARAAAADDRADQAESRVESLEAELEAARSELEQVRTARSEASRREERDSRQRDAEREEAASKQRSADEGKRRELEKSLQAARAEVQELNDRLTEQRTTKTELERQQKHFDQLRVDLEQRTAELDELKDTCAAQLADLDGAEAQLKERAQALDSLRADLRKTERLAEQLISDLEEARSAAPDAPATAPINAERMTQLEERMQELMRIDALRVADLTAAQWSVQELEAKLDEKEHASREEIDRLRQDLQAKDVLLEQLRRDVSSPQGEPLG
jgi:hypothetical protein